MLIAGSTSVSLPILVRDTTSTTGAGLGSLTHETPSLVAEYRREGQSSWTAITLSAGTLGTWSSGGFVADGALTGAYELGLPNAAAAEASGVRWVAVRLRGAANMLATPLFIPLVPSKVTPINIDGLTFEAVLTAMLAAVLNVSETDDDEVVFMKRDGTTPAATITTGGEEGDRVTSVIH